MSRVRAAAALALCFATTACADAMLATPAQGRPKPDASFAAVLSGRVEGIRVAPPGLTRIARCRFTAPGPPAAVVVDGRLVPRDALARLSPADILTVTIRKGADAAREYGAEAAGGVVIVTTRAGTRS